MKFVSHRSRRIAFGVMVGVAMGLLVDSVVVVPTSIWFLTMIFPVVLPPLLGGILGLVLGWLGHIPAVSLKATLLATIPLWFLCIWAPVQVRVWQFRALADHQIPVFPGATLTSRIVQPWLADGGSSVYLEFCVKADTNEILKFYRSEFVQRGWKEFPKKSAGNIEPWDWYPFSKNGRYLSLYVAKGCSWPDYRPDDSFVQIHCSVYNFLQRKTSIPNGWP